MANRNPEESVMDDLDDLLFDIIASSVGHTSHIYVDKFLQLLEEQGFMIVPIEDPTNLRFGVDE